MQSKLARTIISGLALLIPTAPAIAAAQAPPVVATPGQHRYFVEYHTPNHRGMQVKGPYKSRKHAHHVAQQMRTMGIKAKVVQR